MVELSDRELTGRIIGAALRVHQVLGPGFLESVYEEALCLELEALEIPYESQRTIPIRYRGQKVGEHRPDLVVGGGDCGIESYPGAGQRPFRDGAILHESQWSGLRHDSEFCHDALDHQKGGSGFSPGSWLKDEREERGRVPLFPDFLISRFTLRRCPRSGGSRRGRRGGRGPAAGWPSGPPSPARPARRRCACRPATAWGRG